MSVAAVQVKPNRLLFLWMLSIVFGKPSLAWPLVAGCRSKAATFSFLNVPFVFGGRRFATSSSNDPPAKKNIMVGSLLTGKKLVSVEECLKVFGEPGVVFVDGSWFMKDRNARKEFEVGPRIPAARFFDIDDVAAKGALLNPKGLPHMMPPKELFAASMDAMNINNHDHLILYATKGCMFVHRALFQIQAMGHARDRVHLMDGSLADWEEQGGQLDKEPTKAIVADELDLTKPTKYNASDARNVVGMEEIKMIVAKGNQTDTILVDVRSPERFLGLVDEPRPGLRLGHMPRAKNLFFYTLLDPENIERLKPAEDLRNIIMNAGIDVETDKRIVISCGSGATACALATALDICGRKPDNTYIYDGSWMEYGAAPDTMITKS